MRREVWVLAECRNNELELITAEMLSELRQLANKLNAQLCACLLGYDLEECIDPLKNYGAEKVYVADNEMLSEYSLDAYAIVLEELIDRYDPLILAIGATPVGSELAPRISARLKLTCITEVKRLSTNGERLLIAKSSFNDKAYMNFDFLPKRTLIITILPGDMNADVVSKPVEMEITRVTISIDSGLICTRNVGFMRGDPKKIRLQEAELIVAGGKGVDAEGFAVLEELGDVLGASIGGTRPPVDDGLIPFERQIGITGKSVAPNLIIACGISGAREFTVGIEKAKLTIAINNDAKAPIFGVADIGVIGDVNQVIPATIHALKKRRELV